LRKGKTSAKAGQGRKKKQKRQLKNEIFSLLVRDLMGAAYLQEQPGTEGREECGR